ncbi:MAG: slipin family protein [Alphaproteobacteria bacterium]|nr:slipin family protein [Alphaproteobacteria bacterium]
MEILSVPLFFAVIIVFASIKIIKEYERGVVYTFGRYTGLRNPGIRLVIPIIQDMTRVDIRVRTEDIPSQDLISKDNISVRVNAVVYYLVDNPAYAINKVENFALATSQLAQTTLRSVLGKHELDDMLANREQLNRDIQDILESQTGEWGVKISHVVIKNVDIDPSMVRAIAKQAEAERERRAKIINAEGELQAAKQLDEAAAILSQRPETMQLRYLGTLGEFVNAKGNTVVLPMPLDLLKQLGAK